MALPTNVDSTYADSGSDASVALHQQHHDSLHTLYNSGDYFRSGYYTIGIPTTGSSSTTTLTLNRIYVNPFILPVRRAFDRIGINVTSAATASSGGVLRLGIYAHSSGGPAALILDAGTISSETSGAREITISQTLDPGVYWLATVAQVATCGITTLGTIIRTAVISDQAGPVSTLPNPSYTNTGVTGALPGTFDKSGGTTSTAPGVCLRAA